MVISYNKNFIMENTINMSDIRHLNLFSQVTRINTRFSLRYNDMIIFCVPKNFLMKAVGEDARNIRRISEILRRKIRIISMPRGINDARQFIEDIIRPATFKSIEIRNNEIILTAGSFQNKATLIGRGKRRLFEMQKIVKDFFGRDFRIV